MFQAGSGVSGGTFLFQSEGKRGQGGLSVYPLRLWWQWRSCGVSLTPFTLQPGGGGWCVGGGQGYVSLGQNHPHQNHPGPGQARAQRPYVQAGRLLLPSRLRSELDLNRKFNIIKAPNAPSASCASRPQLCVPDSRWCITAQLGASAGQSSTCSCSGMIKRKCSVLCPAWTFLLVETT